MSCKQCGADWKTQVSTQEMLDELALRRESAQEGRRRFYAKAWPNRQFCKGAILWGAIGYLVVFCAVISLFHVELDAHAAVDPIFMEKMLLFLLPTFFWLFLTSFLYERKAHRIRSLFGEDAERDLLLRGEPPM